MKTINLSNLNGTNGFIINGIQTIGEQQSGKSVAMADINGDGIQDAIIGAPMGYPNQGHIYVIFGSATPFNATFDLSSLNGKNGFTITTTMHQINLGYTVSTVDLNNDRFDDIIVGAPAYTSEIPDPKVFVIFGQSSWQTKFDVSTLNGSNGFVMTGKKDIDTIGSAVSNAGDLNKDGINDVLISGCCSSIGTSAFVFFGSKGPFNATVALDQLDGTNGFKIIAGEYTQNKYHVAASVDRAGDFNNDGFGDALIGAPSRSSQAPGKVFVIYGRKSFPSSLNLDAIDKTEGLFLSATNSHLGYSVSYLDDINGDGITDIGMSEFDQNPGLSYASGNSYVVFGGSHSTNLFFNLTTLDGTNGFAINISTQYSGGGCVIKGIGYFNNDNIADFAIGIPDYGMNANGHSGGITFIISGQTSFPAKVTIPQMDSVNGEIILPFSSQGQLGTSIVGMGDFNNDGKTDLLVGAPEVSQEVGATYAIFGSGNVNHITPQPTNTPTLAPFTNHPTSHPHTNEPIPSYTNVPSASPLHTHSPEPHNDHSLYWIIGGSLGCSLLIGGIALAYAKINHICCFGQSTPPNDYLIQEIQ